MTIFFLMIFTLLLVSKTKSFHVVYLGKGFALSSRSTFLGLMPDSTSDTRGEISVPRKTFLSIVSTACIAPSMLNIRPAFASQEDALADFGRALQDQGIEATGRWPAHPSPLPTKATSAASLTRPINNTTVETSQFKTLDADLNEASKSKRRQVNPLTHG